jgi:hypothetical protein
MKERLVAWLLARLSSNEAFVFFQGRVFRIHEVQIDYRPHPVGQVITARGYRHD